MSVIFCISATELDKTFTVMITDAYGDSLEVVRTANPKPQNWKTQTHRAVCVNEHSQMLPPPQDGMQFSLFDCKNRSRI